MPSLSSGAEGAAVGFALGGPLGAGIGALAGLFGGSDPEEERQKRYQELLASYNAARERTLQRLGGRTQAYISEARGAAAQRAAAGGRTGAAAEAFILPSAQGAMDMGEREQEAVNNQFEMLNAQAARDFADRPIEPSTADYLVSAGSGVAEYMQGKRLQDAYKEGSSTPKSQSQFSLPLNIPTGGQSADNRVMGGMTDTTSNLLNRETLSEFDPNTFDRTNLSQRKKKRFAGEDLSLLQDFGG